ncbi:transcriptional regulator [Mesorhizobium sp. YM1C-6-2]|uniref:transcriptional regulator n=1 Tax=Mesorhizobium sp. YM1C-6-2 TaxID=1827501 RepID=UPI000EF1AF12|nr:transcriptional regulator [Mesorhizobium sp. YM1C-6-2]RLP22479.1 transcriptional regulator [Mesorhizobium sp. YM1C-6-2]
MPTIETQIATFRDPSVPGFCARHHLSRSSYYNLKAAGKAPREYVVGKLIRISPEAEAAWVRDREAEAEARATATA